MQNATFIRPRPQGRGPIEAGIAARGRSGACAVHGRKAVAPLKRCARLALGPCQTRRPRPQGRGPIEAIGLGRSVGRGRRRPRPQGRGPIEACRSPSTSYSTPPVHGRKAVAPLKQMWRACEPCEDFPVHGRKAVAPLKHCGASRIGVRTAPRPRPQGRGPIEAPVHASHPRAEPAVHGRKAVAPLKHGRPRPACPCPAPSTAARPWPH